MNIAWPVFEHMPITRARASTRAPNNGGIHSRGPSQGAERSNEALISRIRDLEQEEKEINALIISAGAISASLAWCILRSIQNLHEKAGQRAAQYRDLYSAILSHVPQTYPLASPWVTVPPTITHAQDPAHALSVFGLLRANGYWFTSLVFSLTAISIAVVIKRKIRDDKGTLRRYSRLLERAQMLESLDGNADTWFMSVATNTTYRLFQVSLVVFFLGHVNSFLFPVGITIFIPTVFCGLLYVFGATGGQTVGSE